MKKDNRKENRGRCLALAAVLAMAVCAIAVGMPSGDSDAAEASMPDGAKALPDALDTVGGTYDYYVAPTAQAMKLGRGSAGCTYNLYLMNGAQITMANSIPSGVEFKIYLVASVDAKGVPQTYYGAEKLEVTATAMATYSADASGKYVQKVADEPATGQAVYGVLFVQTGAENILRFYPAGADLDIALATNQKVTVIDGGKITIRGHDNGEDKNIIELEDVSSNLEAAGKDRVSVTGAAGGQLALSGKQTGGSVTIFKGEVGGEGFYHTSKNPTVESTGKPALNAYYQYGKYTSVPQADTLYAFGIVASGTARTHADGVELVNATFSSLTLNGGQVISAEGATSHDCINAVDLELTSGTLRLVSGEFAPSAKTPTIAVTNEGARFDVGAGATVSFSNAGTITLGKGTTMNVYGKLTSAYDVTIQDTPGSAEATFNAYSGAVIGENIKVKTTYGTIEAALKEVTINQDWNTSVTFGQFQDVRVTSNITISQDVVVSILGKLIIDKGASIVIQKGAKLYVGGTGPDKAMNDTAEVEILGDLEIEAGGMFDVVGGRSTTISGKIYVSGTADGGKDSEGFLVASASTVLKSGAAMTVNENAELVVGTGMIISPGVKVTVGGNFSGTGVRNAGELLFSKATIDNSAGTEIYMAGDGAVLEIKEATLTAPGKPLAISDKGLEFTAERMVTDDEANAIVITPRDGRGNVKITGLKVTESVTSYRDHAATHYNNMMDLSGNLKSSDTGSDYLPVVANGASVDGMTQMTVSGSLTIGKGVAFINAGYLSVTGQLTHIDESSSVANSGTLEVSGQAKTLMSDDFAQTVNAAMYEVEEGEREYRIYTSLPDAIASGAANIAASGTIAISADLTVPAGMTIAASDCTVTIGSSTNRDVTLTVEEGAMLKHGTWKVFGTLYFATEKRSDGTMLIESEVRTTDGVFAKHTSVYAALDGAVSGETIRVAGDVVLTQDITVIEGVTLQIPAGISLKLNDGVTVTVMGTLDSWGKVAAATGFAAKAVNDTTDKASAIKVAGVFKSAADLKYADYKIAGAYFSIADSSATYNYASPIVYAASVADRVQDGAIGIYGKVSCEDISFKGTSVRPVTVTVYGTLTAGTIALSDAEVTTSAAATDSPSFTGTVGSDIGKVHLADAAGFTVQEVNESNASVVELGGSPVLSDADQRAGKISCAVEIVSGTVTVRDDDLNVAKSMTVAEGAALLVTKSAAAAFGTLVVNGKADATEAGKIKADVLVVMGTVTVGAADENLKVVGGALKASTIYVGIAAKSATGSSAALNVPEGVSIGADLMYVAAGSTVSGGVTEDMVSTVYKVDGAESVTAYMASNGTTLISALDFPDLAGKKISGWYYVSAGEQKAVTTEVIGEVSSVDASIDTSVYKVAITADYGFVDIFIDGAKVASNDSGIIVYVDPAAKKNGYLSLAAGSHALEWKLKNNYNGDNVSTSFNGAQFSKSFAISSDLDFSKTIYQLVLTGAVEQGQTPVTPSDNGKDGGMGVTDYLLIVLVVLIAVMVIMVAFRITRS